MLIDFLFSSAFGFHLLPREISGSLLAIIFAVVICVPFGVGWAVCAGFLNVVVNDAEGES